LGLLPDGPQSSEYFQLGFSDQAQYEATIKDQLVQKGWELIRGQGYYTLGEAYQPMATTFNQRTTLPTLIRIGRPAAWAHCCDSGYSWIYEPDQPPNQKR